MKTAEEYLKESLPDYKGSAPIEHYMIEFAKMHVEEALKEASKKAETIHDSSFVAELCNMSGNPTLKDITLNDLIWKPSILNAYPPENIK